MVLFVDQMHTLVLVIHVSLPPLHRIACTSHMNVLRAPPVWVSGEHVRLMTRVRIHQPFFRTFFVLFSRIFYV